MELRFINVKSVLTPQQLNILKEKGVNLHLCMMHRFKVEWEECLNFVITAIYLYEGYKYRVQTC